MPRRRGMVFVGRKKGTSGCTSVPLAMCIREKKGKRSLLWIFAVCEREHGATKNLSTLWMNTQQMMHGFVKSHYALENLISFFSQYLYHFQMFFRLVEDDFWNFLGRFSNILKLLLRQKIWNPVSTDFSLSLHFKRPKKWNCRGNCSKTFRKLILHSKELLDNLTSYSKIFEFDIFFGKFCKF